MGAILVTMVLSHTAHKITSKILIFVFFVTTSWTLTGRGGTPGPRLCTPYSSKPGSQKRHGVGSQYCCFCKFVRIRVRHFCYCLWCLISWKKLRNSINCFALNAVKWNELYFSNRLFKKCVLVKEMNSWLEESMVYMALSIYFPSRNTFFFWKEVCDFLQTLTTLFSFHIFVPFAEKGATC